MPKRSVELPSGGKDLIDVEEVREWEPVPHRDHPRQTTDRLAYIAGPLARLLESVGKSKLVIVSRYQNQGQIMVISDPGLPTPIISALWHRATQAQAVRSVFEEAGIPAITGPVGTWKTKDELKYALPVEASEAARLIGEVFQAGYGLEVLSVINLSYHERKRA